MPLVIMKNRGFDGCCGRKQIVQVQPEKERECKELNSCANNTYSAKLGETPDHENV